jgi:hypothetical protein
MGLASRILDSVTEALDIHLLKTLKTLRSVCTGPTGLSLIVRSALFANFPDNKSIRSTLGTTAIF